MATRISITPNNNQERIILCKTPQFVSLYTATRRISDGDSRDWKGRGRRGWEEEQRFLSDNPPPPAHTKATCPWRENTVPLFPPSFPRPLRHEGRAHHPSPKRASRQAAAGTHCSPRLVTPTLPFAPRLPAPRRVSVRGGGRGGRYPPRDFPRGKSPRWRRQRQTPSAAGEMHYVDNPFSRWEGRDPPGSVGVGAQG